MRGPCSGGCCQSFTINTTLDEVHRRGDVQARRLRQILLRIIGEHEYYTCNEFDVETRRCRAYDARPEMCSRFPTKRCRQCGAMTDQEARGVTLLLAGS